MSTQKSEKKEPDAFSGRLIDLLGKVNLSCLEEEIPETDLELLSAKKIREQEPEREERVRRPQRIGWKRVAVFSGVAAAGSAAVTGVIVFACMRHSFGSIGTK